MKTLRIFLVFLVSTVVSAVASAQEMPIYEWSHRYARHSGHGLWSDYRSTTDANGNVYLAAVMNQPMDADPGPGVFTLPQLNSNYDDVYIIKLNSAGAFQWAKSYTRLGAQNGPGSIVIDGSGNVFFASYYQVGFATNQTRINKIDAAGNELWEKQIITNGYGGRELALDQAGNILIAGAFDGTVDFDPNAGVHNVAATSTGTNDEMFLLKLDADGNFLWVKTTSGPGSKRPTSIVTDASGNIVVAGFYGLAACDLDLGSGTENFNSVGSLDVFVMKLEADGDMLWVRSMGGTNSDLVHGVAVNPSGFIFLTGNFSGSGDFDPTAGVATLSTTTDTDIFLVRLNADGSFGWASQFGTPGEPDEGRSVIADAAGNLLFSGSFFGTVDFDPGPGVHNLSASGTFLDGNAFVAKFTENQGLTWARVFSSNSGSHSSMATSIRTDNSGLVTVVGHSSGGFQANFGPCNNTLGAGAHDPSGSQTVDHHNWNFGCEFDLSNRLTSEWGNGNDRGWRTHFELFRHNFFGNGIDYDTSM
jgi:hypothetical protein